MSASPARRAAKRTERLDRWMLSAAGHLRTAGLSFGHGADSPESEAAWIAASVCRLSPRNIDQHLGRMFTAREFARANRILQSRSTEKIPLAYLLKEAWLGHERFYVDSRVIVPRSFIAALIQQRFQPWIKDHRLSSRGLDMCTGSGCLAILMAKAFPAMQVDAVDLSKDALDVAKINIGHSKLHGRVKRLRSDLFASMPAKRRYDLIVSNPPYVKESTMFVLPDEYRHEPRQALAGGADGLEFVRRIILDAKRFLKPSGLLIIEVGHNRKDVEREFPRLPMIWLETPGGDDMVAMINARDLLTHADHQFAHKAR